MLFKETAAFTFTDAYMRSNIIQGDACVIVTMYVCRKAYRADVACSQRIWNCRLAEWKNNYTNGARYAEAFREQ